jgi:predicted nuclease of predicted toxin-antitoxin system
MRLLFDQNISHRILALIPEHYKECSTIKKEGLTNASDKEIWLFARANDFTIVTQDSDFNDLTSLMGFPPKIIWIRAGNLRTHALADILFHYRDEILNFINHHNYGCFEILKLTSH